MVQPAAGPGHEILGVVPRPIRWMHAFVDVPAEQVESAQAFWSAVTGWPVGHPWSGHQEFASLVPPDGAAYVHVQSIGGPPRVHLDLLGDVDRDTTRLEELGATRGPTRDWWQVMSSPAGLPFCLCDERWPHHRPGAASLPDGHRRRVVQLCVDVPVDHYDAELAFWRAATGWG